MDKMVFECSIEQKVFTKGNDSLRYYDIVVNIAGNDIHLAFKEKDKKLAEYLLTQIELNNKKVK